MSNVFVQFSDPTEKTVIAYLAGPQDPISYPNQGNISTSDLRWAAFYDALPLVAQRGLPAPDSA
jgi:hypothetical protein